MISRVVIFCGKILLLFLVLELALRLGGGPMLTRYSFGHKAERLPWWVKDLPTMVKMHQVSRPKAPGELRVIIIGNSAIYGGNIPAGSALAPFLEEVLNQGDLKGRVRVYNLAVNGAYALEDFLVAHEALKYQPDIIIWGLTLRDFYNPPELNKSPLAGFNLFYFENLRDWYIKHGYDQLYNLYWQSYQKDKKNYSEKMTYELSKYWHLFRYRELLREMFIDVALYLMFPDQAKEAVNHYEGNPGLFTLTPQSRLFKERDFTFPNPNYPYVRALGDLLREHQVGLFLFNQPMYANNNAYPPGYFQRYHQDFIEEIAPLGGDSLDLLDALASEKEIFYDMLHLTYQGNRKLAENLYPQLRNYLLKRTTGAGGRAV